MQPGEKREVEINCGKHVLNAFGPRGLTFLNYGADEKRVGEDARQRNLEFKKKQVIDHNTRNEMRRQMGLGFIPASKVIARYATELGVELAEPYQLKEKGSSDPEIMKLREENRELKTRMDKLMDTLESLTAPEKEVIGEPPRKKRE